MIINQKHFPGNMNGGMSIYARENKWGHGHLCWKMNGKRTFTLGNEWNTSGELAFMSKSIFLENDWVNDHLRHVDLRSQLHRGQSLAMCDICMTIFHRM